MLKDAKRGPILPRFVEITLRLPGRAHDRLVKAAARRLRNPVGEFETRMSHMFISPEDLAAMILSGVLFKGNIDGCVQLHNQQVADDKCS